MKTFQTLRELFVYCGTCPLCKKLRPIDISIGPDDFFAGTTVWDKYRNTTELSDRFLLDLKSKFKFWHTATQDNGISNFSSLTHHKISFNINLYDNTANIELDECIFGTPPLDVLKNVCDNNFYFYLFSECKSCESSVNSLDIEFDKNTFCFTNIGVEQENVLLLNNNGNYNITFEYIKDNIQVSTLTRNSDKELVDNNDIINLPLYEMDFSNKDKVIERIKTLTVFS